MKGRPWRSPFHLFYLHQKHQITREGVATGLLNIPCRYMHSGSEVVSLKDIDATAELMARFVLALDKDTSVIPEARVKASSDGEMKWNSFALDVSYLFKYSIE